MTKICFKCGAEKPVEEYYRHSEMGDGRLGKCKDCTRADVRANRAANGEYYRAFDRRRAMNEDRVAARKAYMQTEAGKRSKAKAVATYTERNPQRRDAHIATGNAIRDGRLLRQACEVCGVMEVQAHHPDYSKPLEVRWLCTEHHALVHKLRRLNLI